MAVNFKDTVDLGGNQLVALADPTADQHAATRKYVLDQIAGIGATYTDEQARDALAAALTAGGNIDIVVDDNANTITISVEALTTADLSDFGTATNSAIDARVTGAFVSGLSGVDADTLGGDSKATILAAAASAALDTEEVQDIIGAAITAGNNIDVTYDDAGTGTVTIAVEALTTADLSDFGTATDGRIDTRVTGAFVSALSGVDADTLGGSSKAQVVADAIAGVVDTAPTTLDTLNELAAALGDDPNFATTVTNALALRVQSYATNIGDGTATTYTITHNLNTRDVIVQIYENGDDYDQVWATVKRATVNTVTVTFNTAPTASQYRVVVQGRA